MRLRSAWSLRVPRTSRMSSLVMGRSPRADRILHPFRQVISYSSSLPGAPMYAMRQPASSSSVKTRVA
eukprot:11177334-Lingulodinium_polyedra.AAC.1